MVMALVVITILLILVFIDKLFIYPSVGSALDDIIGISLNKLHLDRVERYLTGLKKGSSCIRLFPWAIKNSK